MATRLRGRAYAPPEMPSLRLGDLPQHGEWVRLGTDPPHEIAFGVVGRFWAGETRWREIDAADFARATDAEARRGFLRYWRVLSPFIGVVLRAALAVVAAEAER